MPSKFTVTPAIASSGFGLSGDIGGLPKQTYYTPDGRVVRAIPCLREYVKKDTKGNVIESGERDSNYDKGWLPVMPADLKPHCDHCGEWHDNKEEIVQCAVKVKKREEWGNRIAKKLMKEETNEEVDGLKKEVAELKEMLQKVLREDR